MTRVKTLLSALADGPPMTADALSEATGIDREHITRALSYLRQAGLIEDTPAMYRIAPAGVRRLTVRPKTPKRVIARKSALRREKRLRELEGARNETMVEQAKRSTPNSVFSMGSMA
ncbi:helix-turn-helix domain-containing protein [Variovorax saccharolyticus]|uniref:helix-turn-helix domain-containing protein n=1 Tax=Variovorax saccharolyticus TaxID=3053516 RepID=UPI002575CC52|nr:helix-turn-helix domain-containing protein [Variovorax sp. J31P216]MDM0024100.1 MarR family transcriptional regulator [Variovorax sp. J31P216]